MTLTGSKLARTGPRNLLKYSKCLRFVTGHDFSRADKSNQINGALEQNHDRYTRGQCLRVLIFQEINTLKNAFQGTFIVILL